MLSVLPFARLPKRHGIGQAFWSWAGLHHAQSPMSTSGALLDVDPCHSGHEVLGAFLGLRVGGGHLQRRFGTGQLLAAGDGQLTQTEVAALLAQLQGTKALLARLLYGTGMPLMEGIVLAVPGAGHERKSAQRCYSPPSCE